MSEILIIGQGNIGTFVGSALLSKNDIVVHYVRDLPNARKQITLSFTDRRTRAFKAKKGKIYQYSLTDNLDDISRFDVIIIPVSHLQFRNVIYLLNSVINPKQTMVLMGNIWNDFEWFNENVRIPHLFAFPNFGGAIIADHLKGWLTQNLTTGITNAKYEKNLSTFNSMLWNAGFRPSLEEDIRGWLVTHFAYNAGMLLEASNQNGFQAMTRNWKSLEKMYYTIRECMLVAENLGTKTENFKEGRNARLPIWWNTLKTYLLFLLPGLAKSADATKDIEEWTSYAKKIYDTSQAMNLETPILSANYF